MAAQNTNEPMKPERDATIPEALRDWLETTRAAKSASPAHGSRPTVADVREALDRLTRTFVTDRPEVALVFDDLIPGPDHAIGVRVYHPAPEETRPVALFVHGGGHISGSVATYDPIARKLALATGWIIVAVEYRLAPEYPYPAGLDDCMACAKQAFRCLAGRGITHEPRLALIGDSGGGALCATMAHRGQFEPGVAFDAQVLIYPSLDYSLSKPSVLTNGEGYLLERERIVWMFDAYFQANENRRAASPLSMEITERLPPTLVVTAQFDPLVDEGVAYVARLLSHGGCAEHRQMPGMVHAYLNLEDLVPTHCRKTYDAIADFLGG